MSNVLPTFFIVLAALALLVTLLALWHSLRHAFAQRIAVSTAAAALVSPERAALLAEKQSLLVALKDLEAEREAGKLSNADFRDLNEQYRTRAREVLRQLDVLLAPHRENAKALLSSVTAAGSGAAAPVPSSEREVSAVQPCQSCGADNDADAVFCKRCGTRLGAGVPG
jgi:hypothetical protein